MNIQPEQALIHIVDDDEAMRESLQFLFESNGYQVNTYRSGQLFLDNYDPEQCACLVLDIRMPGMNGIELQHELIRRNCLLPIIFITGHGEVPTAVEALKQGAIDYIEKPFDTFSMLDRVEKALEIHLKRLNNQQLFRHILECYQELTTREEEIFNGVVQGKSNRDIADSLDISVKTVEAHRAKMMSKMGAHSLADLVRMSLLLNDKALTS